IKTILIFFVICCTYTITIYADDSSEEIIILPPINKDKPYKPQAPSRVQLQAYYNGIGITITSSVTLQAEVMIYDNLTEEQYYNGVATLAPSFFCEIPVNAKSVSIIINTPSAEYQGVLYK
ncbi:MAG: hypothetical protein K2I89_04215, partial [Muribaculaceae bacterium]|nr:hypothetical protein [Muribaculaceae bacterium]